MALLALTLTGGANAEEGGSGHYMPGSMSSFMDGVAAGPTFIARVNVLGYDGRLGADRELPIAGLVALDVDVRSEAYALTLFWRPSWGGVGEKWSYAMGATIPLVDLRVSATVSDPELVGNEGVRRSDSLSGLGDLVLMPVMMNYNVNPDFNANFHLGI